MMEGHDGHIFWVEIYCRSTLGGNHHQGASAMPGRWDRFKATGGPEKEEEKPHIPWKKLTKNEAFP